MFTVRSYNLVEFIFYSISGGDKLPWLMHCLFQLYALHNRFVLKIHFPIVKSLREYNMMLYLLEVWYYSRPSIIQTPQDRGLFGYLKCSDIRNKSF